MAGLLLSVSAEGGAWRWSVDPSGVSSLQDNPCPRAAPGTVLWGAKVADPPLSGIAVSDQGLILVAKRAQDAGPTHVIALDCHGVERWRHNPVAISTPFYAMLFPSSLPAVDTGGDVVATGWMRAEGRHRPTDPSVVPMAWRLDPEGRLRSVLSWPWPPEGRFFADLVMDAADRAVTVGVSFPLPRGNEPSAWFVATLDRFGAVADHHALTGEAVHGAPIGLADGRILVPADAESAVVLSTAPTAAPPARTPPPARARIFLPVVPATLQPRATAVPAGPSARVDLSARLIAIAADRRSMAVMPADIGASFRDSTIHARGLVSLVAAGDVVVASIDFPAPKLTAIHVGDAAARTLWEHAPGIPIVESPVLGRLDPATGRLELVYARFDGVVVSLDVPGTASAAGGVTFNWAVELDATSPSPPVLGDAGAVYVAHGSRVSAFDRADGRELWSASIDDPEFAGSGVVTATTGGIALGPDGTLYATAFGHRTRLVAIATESGGLDPEAGWATVRHDSRRTGRATP